MPKTIAPAEPAVSLRAALNDLAGRYEAIASKATTDVGKSRARQIGQAARDIRHVLTTGRIPEYLITDSKPEVTQSPPTPTR